jgi:hypothetical protein
MPKTETSSWPTTRLNALRGLLENGEASTQEELREELEKLGYDVTQSTISRSLKKLGALKGTERSPGFPGLHYLSQRSLQFSLRRGAIRHRRGSR